jgi:chromosome segregation ATPase
MENERNAITIAHQSQISQLKENFKEKLKLNDNLTVEMQQDLEKERLKHEQELKNLEDDLRKHFKVDCEIQEQKYQEMLAKYKQQLSENELKYKSNMVKYENEYLNIKSEYNRLYEENKNFKNDISKLTSVIKDLHETIEKKQEQEDKMSQENMLQFKRDSVKKETEISELRNRLISIERLLNESQNEVKILQETVHHECMERQELHEKLETTREELLLFKKNSYASPSVLPSLKTSQSAQGIIPYSKSYQQPSSAPQVIDVNNNPTKFVSYTKKSYSQASQRSNDNVHTTQRNGKPFLQDTIFDKVSSNQSHNQMHPLVNDNKRKFSLLLSRKH